MDVNIVQICGESSETPDFEKIANNPNFVFTPDASFDIKVLYDLDGNVINVNSWLECANYVNGGWFSEIIDLINYEQRLFITLSIILSVTLVRQMVMSRWWWSYFKK